ncbi:MAG: toll/interleukin-1 receptor domain-containing protein, partial [Acidobacteriota bacterium]
MQVFIAYSHTDEPLKNELVKHLSPLRRLGLIQHWHDRRIAPGADWNREIDAHLNRCQIILLLSSADFINSDYCYGIEMARADSWSDQYTLARHDGPLCSSLTGSCIQSIAIHHLPRPFSPFPPSTCHP